MGDDSEYPEAYYLDDKSRKVDAATLRSLGVLAWRVDADNFEKDEKLAHIRQSRGYKNHDFVLSSKIPDLESKLETFKTEHIHYDEEIRLLLDGSGYFDLKDAQDNWIRVETPKNQLIVLPAGSYHRFMPDDKLFFHAMRLFQDEPIWTPYNRGTVECDESEYRHKYEKEVLKI